MEIYFIRHGQSTQNRGDSRVPYPPLTDLGRLQAKHAGEHLKSAGIRHLYCSPMYRAMETASIIGDAIGQTPEVLIELCEWGGIHWEDLPGGWDSEKGLSRREIFARFPHIRLPESVTEEGWWHRPVEPNLPAMCERAREHAQVVIAHLKTRHLPMGDTVALVSHGGSGATLLTSFLGVTPEPDYDCFWHNNTGISRVRFTGNRVTFHYVNRLNHLTDEMITY